MQRMMGGGGGEIFVLLWAAGLTKDEKSLEEFLKAAATSRWFLCPPLCAHCGERIRGLCGVWLVHHAHGPARMVHRHFAGPQKISGVPHN